MPERSFECKERRHGTSVAFMLHYYQSAGEMLYIYSQLKKRTAYSKSLSHKSFAYPKFHAHASNLCIGPLTTLQHNYTN